MKRKGLSRRLLSVLLTLVMLLSMLPQVVFAAEPTPGTWKKSLLPILRQTIPLPLP